MNPSRLFAYLVIWAIVTMSLSYTFAVAGHPGSVWLWRDILGLLP